MSHYALVQYRLGEVSRGQVRSTRVAGITTSSSYVTREAGDGMVKALTRP